MTVYFDKRRKRWCHDFERGGERKFGYCLDADGKPVTSRRAAVAAENVAIRAAETALKAARVNDLTLAQVVADLIPQWETEADWPNKERYIREILAYLRPERSVASISDADLEDYRTWALQQPVMIWTGGSKRRRDDPESNKFWKPSGRLRSAATVNRYLVLIRLALDRAHKVRDPATNQRAIEEVPVVADLPERKRKARPIPDGVLTHAMEALPQHVREALTATLFFGFRQSEIFSLLVHDVDFELGGVWMAAEDVKDDEDAFLPGAPEAMAFMRVLVDQAHERGVSHLITWRRTRKDREAQARERWRPIASPKSAWRTAMKAVQEKFGRRYRWHDIRAAFITHVALTSGGVAAKALARHSDFRTTEAYIHVADEVQRAAANRAAQRPALSMVLGGKSQTGVPDSGERRKQKRY